MASCVFRFSNEHRSEWHSRQLNTPWTVESLTEAAAMSRSAFAARLKELLGQTPLEYVTEWRMQKAMQLLEQRDKSP
jgi:AraC-like DNA-binding protein